MPDVQEVFRMATQKVRPDPGALERQFRGQRKQTARRKAGAILLSAAVVATAVVFGVLASSGEEPEDRVVGGEGPTRLGVLDLAIVDLDGSVQTELDLPEDSWMAELSPDGTEVFFLTRDPKVGFCGACPTVQRLAMMPVGGSEFDGAYVYLTGTRGLDREGQHAMIEHPALSPDGARLAFVGVRRDGNRDIYVASLARSSGGPTIDGRAFRLTTDPATDTFPAWSPDGSTIYYENAGAEPLDDSGFSSTQEIWRVPAGGGRPLRLTNNAVPDSQPDVRADGTIAFWRGGNVWTMAPSGEEQRTLNTVRLGLGFNPRWSPDGTKLVMLTYDGERAHLRPDLGRTVDLPLLDVVVVDVRTGEITEVGTQVASDVNPPSWTPGGALLINRYVPSG